MGLWAWIFLGLTCLSVLAGIYIGLDSESLGPFFSGLVVGFVFLMIALFVWILPKHWNAEMDQAIRSMQSQGYPEIKWVSMDPWISVTFDGCNVKLDIDQFSGNWMPYMQSGGDGLLSSSGPKVPLSPYYIRNQFGCGLDQNASGSGSGA